MSNKSVSDRMAKVERRYGKTLGASSGAHGATKWKVRPSGNPIKKKVGVKATKKV